MYEASRPTACWCICCRGCISSHSVCFGVSNPDFSTALAMGRTRLDLWHHFVGDSKFRMEIPRASGSCCLLRWRNQCHSIDHDCTCPNTLHYRRTCRTSSAAKERCRTHWTCWHIVLRCLVVVGHNDRHTKPLRRKSSVLFRDAGISIFYKYFRRSDSRYGLLAQLRRRRTRLRNHICRQTHVLDTRTYRELPASADSGLSEF